MTNRHIGAKHDDLTKGFDWWTAGTRHRDTGWLVQAGNPEHVTQSSISFIKSLVHAQLRDIRESEPDVFQPEQQQETLLYRKRMFRATQKYGVNSPQVKLLGFRARVGQSAGDGNPSAPECLPSWSDVISNGRAKAAPPPKWSRTMPSFGTYLPPIEPQSDKQS